MKNDYDARYENILDVDANSIPAIRKHLAELKKEYCKNDCMQCNRAVFKNCYGDRSRIVELFRRTPGYSKDGIDKKEEEQ